MRNEKLCKNTSKNQSLLLEIQLIKALITTSKELEQWFSVGCHMWVTWKFLKFTDVWVSLVEIDFIGLGATWKLGSLKAPQSIIMCSQGWEPLNSKGLKKLHLKLFYLMLITSPHSNLLSSEDTNMISKVEKI